MLSAAQALWRAHAEEPQEELQLQELTKWSDDEVLAERVARLASWDISVALSKVPNALIHSVHLAPHHGRRFMRTCVVSSCWSVVRRGVMVRRGQ